MLRSLFTWLVIAIVAVLGIGLALLNTEPVEISYHYGTWELPLSLLVGLCIAAGALLGVATSLLVVLNLKRQVSGLRRSAEKIARKTNEIRAIPIKKPV